MKPRLNKKSLLLLEALLMLGFGLWCYRTYYATGAAKEGQVEVTLQLPKAQDKVLLYRAPDGGHRYIVTFDDGRKEDLSPEEVAGLQHRDRAARSWGQKLMNISSPGEYLWVGLGLLGQILFTGRMVVQLFVSEKEKKSTVPPAFWWMSLGGASMLIVYFIWRQDPIGILGQLFGWFIYIRNLWMIYHPATHPEEDPLAKAEGEEAGRA